MKTRISTVLTATLALAVSPVNLHAGDDAWVALGGFVAGVITGSVIERSDNFHGGVSVSIGNLPCNSHCHGHGRLDCGVCFVPGPAGYWEVTRVRIWIPGYWEVVINHCGDRVRVWHPGRYEYRPHRVWVARGHRPYPGAWDRHDRYDRRDRHDHRRGHDDDRDDRHERGGRRG